MPQYPRSAYDPTLGLVYFARMLDKLRLHAAKQMPVDYHANLGKGMDGRMCRHLRVDYEKLCHRVLSNTDDADETILEWCYNEGRALDDQDVLVWNCFATKRGWKDDDGASEFFQEIKAKNGFADRDDIQTFFELFEVEEKRKP